MIKIASKRRKKFKLSKKKLTRFIIIITIVVILIIISNLIKINNMLEENTEQEIAQLDYQNPKNFEEVLKKHEIECYSKKYNEEEAYNEFKVNFKYDLYEDGESKEKYFNEVIKELSKYTQQNYKLVDSKRNIEIYVKNSEIEGLNYTINESDNYFANEENVKILNTYKKIEELNEKVYHTDVNQITSVQWDISKTSRNNLTIDEDGNFVTKDNAIIELDRSFVKRIVFDENYEEKIISGIKVGTDFEKIEKELGTPTFENEELSMIGYKLREEYIFFYPDKAILYPNIEFDNKTFEEELFEYYEGKTDLSRSKFANKILSKYKDFESSIEEDVLVLRSMARQIEIRIDKNNSIEIEVYNNYNLGNQMKNNIRDNNVIPSLNKDYIYINEIQQSSN